MTDNTEHHFFVTSVSEWRACETLLEAVKTISKDWDGQEFNLWRVPGPQKQSYEIRMYSPQVEGAELIYSGNKLK